MHVTLRSNKYSHCSANYLASYNVTRVNPVSKTHWAIRRRQLLLDCANYNIWRHHTCGTEANNI